jgi:ElaB/YqjD/DUF883 family membrane-anchored ribosome-binding protein
MDNETEMIRQEMEERRNSLQDKLETLEQQVKETVQEATETVHTVTEAVQETVETVKESVQETVESVKQSLDVSQHYQAHPWVFIGGAAAAGFVGAHLLDRAMPEPRPTAVMPAVSASSFTPPTTGRGNGARVASQPPKPSLWEKIAEHYTEELKKLQGLAIGAVASVVRELITSSTGPAVAEQVNDLVDSVTVKLGGKPMHGPLFASKDDASAGSSPHNGNAARSGRSEGVGASSAPVASEGPANRIFNTPGEAC